MNGDPISVSAAPAAARPSSVILPVFVVTSFLSAWLLFAVQPMFAKMVLPLLGGTPAVWNTAMLFFQATLLAGYTYVHFTSRLFGLRRQMLVHLAVLAVAAVSLPIGVVWTDSFAGQPIPWLIAVLTLSVGLPFFAVSASAPLLQRWFGHSGHAQAHDPYFLYGASNLGSILALLSYPALVEPLLRLEQQSWTWAGGYGALVLLIAGCALILRRSRAGAEAAQARPARAGERVSWRRRAHWIALAVAPSSLLLAVTTRITTDIAAVPLLWVVPLSLYLLTFVLVFARRPLLRHSWMVKAQPFVLVPALMYLPLSGFYWTVSLVVVLTIFFVTAMVCHGELARLRPSVSHLTDFYFAMALGGVLGGAFNVLAAPILFADVYEFHLALVVACMLRPRQAAGKSGSLRMDIALPAGLLVLLVVPEMLGLRFDWQASELRRTGSVIYVVFPVLAMCAVFGFKERPLRFGLGIGVYLLAQGLFSGPSNVVDQARSFFGVYKVSAITQDGDAFILRSGTTRHGAQYVDPGVRRQPLAYYTQAGPLGQVFAALAREKRPRSVGLVGLGVGAAVCYQQPGQRWTIYEIDPLVTRIARDTRFFHYLGDCLDESRMEIVHGDARLSLQSAADGQFDLLILDAFASDSVPVHLLTREAMALYFDKLSEDGMIMFHISNRSLELVRVVSGVLGDLGLFGLRQRHSPDSGATALQYVSHWVAIGRNAQALAFLADDPRWEAVAEIADPVLWTDDFSNIVSVIR